MSDVSGTGFENDQAKVATKDGLGRGVPRIQPPVPQGTALHKASHQSSVFSNHPELRTEECELRADGSLRLYNL
jgi:hypothetical protein